MVSRVERHLARFQTDDDDDDDDVAMLSVHCVLGPMLFALGHLLFRGST